MGKAWTVNTSRQSNERITFRLSINVFQSVNYRVIYFCEPIIFWHSLWTAAVPLEHRANFLSYYPVFKLDYITFFKANQYHYLRELSEAFSHLCLFIWCRYFIGLWFSRSRYTRTVCALALQIKRKSNTNLRTANGYHNGHTYIKHSRQT